MSTNSRVEQKNKLFELAKHVYALHRTIVQIESDLILSAKRDHLIFQMESATQEFHSLSGIVETGIDHFGNKGPILCYPDKEKIDYGVGIIESEQILDRLRKSLSKS